MEFDINFYHTGAWHTKRRQVLKRDKYICQRCKRYGKLTEAKVVHHIKHYDEYPELGLDAENLISLCIPCHNKQHPEKIRNARTQSSIARY